MAIGKSAKIGTKKGGPIRDKLIPKGEVIKPREPVIKRSPGQPTKYLPEMCALAVEMGKEGCTQANIAASFEVSRECLHEWMRVHPEFFNAMRTARYLAQSWWEDRAKAAIDKPAGAFNSALFAKMMASQFPQEYRDKIDHTMAGVPGAAPIVTASLTQEDALARYLTLIKETGNGNPA